MIYTLNSKELQQISEIYETDVSVLVERLEIEDEILSFQPFENGLKIQTTRQQLILRLKDRPLNMGGDA